MPKFVSEIETSLSAYVHPQLEFMDVLNEVLPQLASRGIWKDLTKEVTITLPSASTRFFTLPLDTDSLLYAMADNIPTDVRPLWNAFVNAGASSARMGTWFGVEDAGFSPTEEILSEKYTYGLFLFPSQRGWDETDPPVPFYTVDAFTGDERIIVEYENWEGVGQTKEFTPRAVASPQGVVHGVRSIRAIRYLNFSVPGTLIAVPIPSYGLLSYDSGGAPDTQIDTLDNNLVDDFSTTVTGGTARVYSLDQDTTFQTAASEGGLGSFVTKTETELTGDISGTWGGTDPTDDRPAAVYNGSLFSGMETERGTDYLRLFSDLEGSGTLRYNLFRMQASGTKVQALCRRAIPKYSLNSELVYIDNISALKYAFLANTAEYNNDVTQADAWWARAERELNNDLKRYLGAATPKPQFDPSGGMGPVEAIQ